MSKACETIVVIADLEHGRVRVALYAIIRLHDGRSVNTD